jgi:hypothetical protein
MKQIVRGRGAPPQGCTAAQACHVEDIMDQTRQADQPQTASTDETVTSPPPKPPAPKLPKEIGGPSGPEPTRYGDWEHKGRCSDF